MVGRLDATGQPDANIYSRPFGPSDEGTVIYLIRDAERVVNVLDVIWVD